jgi:hypothetical protein
MDVRATGRGALAGAALAGALLSLIAGCAKPDEKDAAATPAKAPRPEAAARPWTPAFPRASVLIAERIEIVGPRELIDHLAITQNPASHAHAETATREGMRIEKSQLPDSDREPINAHLDALMIAATERLVVLFSPNAKQVTIEARGDVYFREIDSGEEKRAQSLRLVGAP